MSFNRSRTHNHSTTYDSSRRDMPKESSSSSYRTLYRPRFSRSHSSTSTTSSSTSASTRTRTPSLEEDIIPLTNALSLSRNNSFTMKTLNPKRLSMRLKGKPACEARDARSNTDPLPTSASGGGRAEFIYKPIRRTDYTAGVSGNCQGSRPVPAYNYNYIPSSRGRRAGVEEEEGPVRARDTPAQIQVPTESRSRSRAQAHYTRHEEDDMDVRSDLYNDLGLDEEYGTSSSSPSMSMSPSLRPPRDADVYSSAAEKRRKKAARRLTTVMVPDAEDIYG